jgi:hypothetical protein
LRTRILLIFSVLVLFAISCEKEFSTRIPVSESARAWVPENQDSVLFQTDLEFQEDLDLGTNRDKDNYLIYGFLASQFTSGADQREMVTQSVEAVYGNFSLDYQLTAGFPTESDTTGTPGKLDVLLVSTSAKTYQILISNSGVTTDFFVVDTINFFGKEYVGVLTDSTNFYFTKSDGIVAFFDGTKWYYKD